MAKGGTFKKGFDPRRFNGKGITEYHIKVAELMRELSLEAVEFVYNTMQNGKLAPKLRFIAAKEILDRGLGKPINITEIHDATSAANPDDIARLSDEQLVRLMQADTGRIGRVIEGETGNND